MGGLDIEVWRDVDGYAGIYSVSSYGRVKRMVGQQCKKERILKPLNNGRDYLNVRLCKEGKTTALYVHRLVASAFIENKLNKAEVNHIDGNIEVDGRYI